MGRCGHRAVQQGQWSLSSPCPAFLSCLPQARGVEDRPRGPWRSALHSAHRTRQAQTRSHLSARSRGVSRAPPAEHRGPAVQRRCQVNVRCWL